MAGWDRKRKRHSHRVSRLGYTLCVHLGSMVVECVLNAGKKTWNNNIS
jgi:hypothetical protein